MKTTRDQKMSILIENTKIELEYAIQTYIKNMTKDTERNVSMAKDFSNDWKVYAQKINTLQKIIKVDPFAFEMMLIKRLKELSNANN